MASALECPRTKTKQKKCQAITSMKRWVDDECKQQQKSVYLWHFGQGKRNLCIFDCQKKTL